MGSMGESGDFLPEGCRILEMVQNTTKVAIDH